MTLREAINKGEGKAGHWRVEKGDDDRHYLYHYSTLMLTWEEVAEGQYEDRDMSLGKGSRSDQGGMNVAFRELDLPYRYDRDRRGGGPRIVVWRTGEQVM